MTHDFIIKARKIVTVSSLGTIDNGGLLILNGKIKEILSAELVDQQYDLEIIDMMDYIITPGLIDCHTHLLEFAPSSLYPITQETHFLAAHAIILEALSNGITAIGEQLCGHPQCDFNIEHYRKLTKTLPIDCSFATTSITIGFDQPVHFSAITSSTAITKEQLLDPLLINQLAIESDYPGENLFLNATPANFTAETVPRAGEIVYTQEELNNIVNLYHKNNKKIGIHVAGKEGIDMALEAGIDVLHHAHGITKEQIKKVSLLNKVIVATPLGGTHLIPNSPTDIAQLVEANIITAIATDAYLPPYPNVDWLPYQDTQLRGPESLLTIAHPSMKLLHDNGYNENDILALLTLNPAKVLGKEQHFGSLEPGKDANFLVTSGLPGIEITDASHIYAVYLKGKLIINRLLPSSN
ncbi:amidohydrolase family protein [Bacillus massiliigorillae]|uniref:amidohydrolase family protein n=1 Tax=Bacillus massiliigorillae TaxID=1243664 RepID=UPI0003A5B15D|nr:amidohydrolase family protein [Bacillus massiliigorillae]